MNLPSKLTTLMITLLLCRTVLANQETAPSAIKNLKTLPGKVLTGGQPDKENLAALKQQGITTVINFRGEGEFTEFDEARYTEQLGMDYLHIPIDSKAALTRENVERFKAALTEHQQDVFLHCGSGNRVGALFALDAYWNDGKSAAEALKIGEEAGLTSLKSYVETLMTAQ
ncbi:fused DSP-PTPase phosphatase/NAD kinase-like protein [Planctobacterium marinum]|uniref:fused DSP-PTPase phosphatase/NAD kinase-like protein n=1 Tax=Planctobacterium marinum TaxID=1631968 RepID=UPI001E328F6C|nr:protein tyrosine phosphatase family protein [Planctobacterium marinum]MCC2605954.1 protein tyrosine phosphatase family protein [Planctobacterium marinum]